MADTCPDCYGSGFTAETLLCQCQIGRIIDATLAPWRAEVERLREAIEFAHSEGFEWPSDPLPAGSVIQQSDEVPKSG